MTDDASRDLPAQIADAIASIPKALVPNCVKALDRLMGAAVDIPVAWLEQQKAKLDARTGSYKAVEIAIGNATANQAAGDQEIINQALGSLVNKAYRKQKNIASVTQAALETLSSEESTTDTMNDANSEDETLDDDWLNVFERYAEDATSERMQGLWGRVLAGEIRKPGRYSLRTLRFLSEFSQSEALLFEEICQKSFGFIIPNKLAKPSDVKNVKPLIHLEAAGLITGATGVGIACTTRCNSSGGGILIEGNLAIAFKSTPNNVIRTPMVGLTPLAQELVGLLPGRDPLSAARMVAYAMRTAEIEECYLMRVVDGKRLQPIERLWQSTPTEKTESSPDVSA